MAVVFLRWFIVGRRRFASINDLTDIFYGGYFLNILHRQFRIEEKEEINLPV